MTIRQPICVGLVSLLLFAQGLAVCAFAAERNTGPWDMAALTKEVPKAEWGEAVGLVRPVFYENVPLAGKPTRVFAYYARPATGDGPFPAMVLVHGGGGEAFREWAEHWGKRGYVALAMDLAGHGPEGRLPDGGPTQDDGTKFREFTDADSKEMWTYHAVSAVVRGHSLLANRPEVDSQRIGITGISWGGYLTCIVAGIDARLKVAVPVYGCGFLDQNSFWIGPQFSKMTAGQRERWVRQFDPSQYLPGVSCPILFLNGTNDFAYPPDSYKKSYSLVTAPRSISMQVRLPHGHIWTFGEVDGFVDSVLRGTPGLPKLEKLETNGETATARMTASTPIKKAELHFTSDTGEWQKREWKTTDAVLQDGLITATLPSQRPLVFFLSVTDERGLKVSTQHEER